MQINTNENENNNNSNSRPNNYAQLMQTMSECSKHTYFPHLEPRNWHFLFFFRLHKVHRSLLFNEALFSSRVSYIFLVAEIGVTGCNFL